MKITKVYFSIFRYYFKESFSYQLYYFVSIESKTIFTNVIINITPTYFTRKKIKPEFIFLSELSELKLSIEYITEEQYKLKIKTLSDMGLMFELKDFKLACEILDKCNPKPDIIINLQEYLKELK